MPKTCFLNLRHNVLVLDDLTKIRFHRNAFDMLLKALKLLYRKLFISIHFPDKGWLSCHSYEISSVPQHDNDMGVLETRYTWHKLGHLTIRYTTSTTTLNLECPSEVVFSILTWTMRISPQAAYIKTTMLSCSFEMRGFENKIGYYICIWGLDIQNLLG